MIGLNAVIGSTILYYPKLYIHGSSLTCGVDIEVDEILIELIESLISKNLHYSLSLIIEIFA